MLRPVTQTLRRHAVPRHISIPRRSYALSSTLTKRTFTQFLLYKKDGTPRSKIKGLVNLSLFAVALYTLNETLLLVEELDDRAIALQFAFQAQRTDFLFRDRESEIEEDVKVACDYFFELFKPYMTIETDEGLPGNAADAEEALRYTLDTLSTAELPIRDKFHTAIKKLRKGVHKALEDGAKRGTSALEIAWEIEDVAGKFVLEIEAISKDLQGGSLDLGMISGLREREEKRKDGKGKDKGDYEIVEE